MLKLAGLFADNAVLQRDLIVPVWGWGEPNCFYECLFDGSVKAMTASREDGYFMFRLEPMEAGGPHTLAVRNTKTDETVESKNILVGEVWIAGGQSNMEWDISNFNVPAKELAADDGLRMLTVPHCAISGGRVDVGNVKWDSTDPEKAQLFSAAGYFFAKKLRDELEVPVGIISSNWGGTVAEAWTSRDTLRRNPAYRALANHADDMLNCPEKLKEYVKDQEDVLLTTSSAGDAAMIQKVKETIKEYPANLGFEKGWAASDCDESDWQKANLPAPWQSFSDYQGSGVFWFRKTIEIPADWQGRDLKLCIGGADKHDVTYFNGSQVGATGEDFDTSNWSTPRQYTVPGNLVKAGKNTIAVRVYSFAFNGGLIGPVVSMHVGPTDVPDDQTIALNGEWLYRDEVKYGVLFTPQTSEVFGIFYQNTPGILYDNMILPIAPYATRGAIFYQGESNEYCPEKYKDVMLDLIDDWQRLWGQDEFAFIQVLLAGFREPKEIDLDSKWPVIREAQINVAKETGNLFASAVDIGEELNIHPFDKKSVGDRLAVAALKQIYGFDYLCGVGPTFWEVQMLSDKVVRIVFDNVGEGLSCKGSNVEGFYGRVGDQYEKLTARIVAPDTVELDYTNRGRTFEIRYAWSDNPDTANLYNSDGLPASPFRT